MLLPLEIRWKIEELIWTYKKQECLKKINEHEHIRTFVKWVAKRPPEFYDGSQETADRKRKRRR